MKTLTQKTRRFASYPDIPKTYRELCQLYLPRPIHDDAEDAEASAMMYALAVFARLNAEQRDYLNVLKQLLEEQDKSAADLSRLLGGSRNLGAMILRGERKLTLNHVRTLARHFRVSADLFL
jgi:antitoxin component HigA of HigAB toxin-antitoxin module